MSEVSKEDVIKAIEHFVSKKPKSRPHWAKRIYTPIFPQEVEKDPTEYWLTRNEYGDDAKRCEWESKNDK